MHLLRQCLIVLIITFSATTWSWSTLNCNDGGVLLVRGSTGSNGVIIIRDAEILRDLLEKDAISLKQIFAESGILRLPKVYQYKFFSYLESLSYTKSAYDYFGGNLLFSTTTFFPDLAFPHRTYSIYISHKAQTLELVVFRTHSRRPKAVVELTNCLLENEII